MPVGDLLNPLVDWMNGRIGQPARPDIVQGELEAAYLSGGFLLRGIQVGSQVMGSGFCSSVLIGRYRVATAAHCIYDGPGDGNEYFWGIDYSHWTGVGGGMFFPAANLLPVNFGASAPHPCYNQANWNLDPVAQAATDIGFLTLYDRTPFGANLQQRQPARVAALEQLGDLYRILGYGATSNNGFDFGTRKGADWNVTEEVHGQLIGQPGSGWLAGGDSGGPIYLRNTGHTLGVANGGGQQSGSHAKFSSHARFMNLPGEICNNSVDDDGDGYIDLLDFDCQSGGSFDPCGDEAVVLQPGQKFEVTSSTDNKRNDIVFVGLPSDGDDYGYHVTVPNSGSYEFFVDASQYYAPSLVVTSDCSFNILASGSAPAGGTVQRFLDLTAGQEVTVWIDGPKTPDPHNPSPACLPLLPLSSGGTFFLRVRPDVVQDQHNPCSAQSSAAVAGQTQKSQSFVPSMTGDLAHVTLPNSGAAGLTTLAIFAAPNDVPQGQPLASTTIMSGDDFIFSTRPHLTAGTKFALVVSNTGGAYNWQWSLDPACYGPGVSATSNNGGQTWGTDVSDFRFTTFMAP